MLNRCKELKKLLRGSDLLLKRSRVTAYDEQKHSMVQEVFKDGPHRGDAPL
jgi:hypothetical protein